VNAGTSGASGSLFFKTGTASSGNTGTISFNTGDAVNGVAGRITMASYTDTSSGAGAGGSLPGMFDLF
jgi:hypothetical protein|tara:strand:+ start:413 stop:616 length:204 start_codon:yes stop_codon:yes gene_type:complete